MPTQPRLFELPYGDAMSLPKNAGEVLMSQPTFVDLFCGCGGLSFGFHMAGFVPLYGVDMNSAALATHRANLDCPVWDGPIQDFVEALEQGTISLPRVDVVIGGPPCQGFSPLGKMSARDGRLQQHSQMNELWQYFVRVVEILRPKVFVTENVPEFIRSEQFHQYKQRVEALGYSGLIAGVLKAEEHGVPQKRRRAFCIGSRVGEPMLPPASEERVTVRDAIGHLPPQPDGENWHIGRNPTPKSVERYRAIPPGGNRFDLLEKRPDIAPECWKRKVSGSTDVFGRLEWDGLALTIRTEFYKPEKGTYLHPEQDRPITHREAACLQSFPTTFQFIGSKIQVARQIGEAVPPRLACQVARAVLAILSQAGEESVDEQSASETQVRA